MSLHLLNLAAAGTCFLPEPAVMTAEGVVAFDLTDATLYMAWLTIPRGAIAPPRRWPPRDHRRRRHEPRRPRQREHGLGHPRAQTVLADDRRGVLLELVDEHGHQARIARLGFCSVCQAAQAQERVNRRAALTTSDPTAPDPGPGSFGGATYQPELDYTRLHGQVRRVWEVVRDRRWWTLAGIAQVLGEPEASVSARLRDLRKPAFGGYEVERRRGNRPGVHEYRLTGRYQGHPDAPEPTQGTLVGASALRRPPGDLSGPG